MFELGMRIALTGLLFALASSPFIKGRMPRLWVAIPLLFANAGGVVAMMAGFVLMIWGY